MAKDPNNHCPRCHVEIRRDLVACKPDWYALPEEIRRRILANFVGGQTLTTASAAYLDAYQDALRWYQANPLPADTP